MVETQKLDKPRRHDAFQDNDQSRAHVEVKQDQKETESSRIASNLQDQLDKGSTVGKHRVNASSGDTDFRKNV
jgi:hypothetical protein